MDLSDDAPAGAAILALGPDQHTDLQQLGELLARMLPEAGTSVVAFGEQPVALRSIGRLQIAGPAMHGGCLVLAVGSDLERQSRRFFDQGNAAPFALDEGVREASFGLQLEVRPLLANLTRLAEAAGEGGGNARFLQLLDIMGAGAIAKMTATIAPDGKYVGQTIAVDFDGQSRGLIGLMLPPRRSRPALLRLLPPAARTYSMAPLDGRSLQEFYGRVFDLLGPDLPMSREELEQQFTAMTKLRLVDDFLALIGDGYMRIDDLAAPIDSNEDVPEHIEKVQDQFSNACYVLEVRDGVAFARNLDTAIRARGLHVGRKSEDYAGTPIYRMNVLGMFPIEYAVVGSLFVLGVGESEGTRQNLRGVLDAVAAGRGAPTGFSPAVQQRLADLPEDWSGISVASLTEGLDGMIATFEGMRELFALEEDDDSHPWLAAIELAKALRPELRRLDADTSVAVDYLARDRWLSRSRW